ncbi:hypothetical protein GE061_009432 [Apolygus lucorum]|uniref:Uncharacterized protein n=1 Tax=Apolygus lucorum TaxID=248454 RepID=A0A8S9Y1P3_APOLU|nr:hypothetical protein GE061_009432 [Apolygus lucorum]
MMFIPRATSLFNMNSILTVFVGLTLIFDSDALPVGYDVDVISLAGIGLHSFYSEGVTHVKQPVKYGFGFDKNGTFTAGFRFTNEVLFNKPWALTGVVSGNPKDLMNTFRFEIGTNILKGLAGAVYGDKNGLKWLSSFWAPVVHNRKGLNGIGLSMEGANLKPVAVSGGVDLNNEVYQGRIQLDKNLKPFSANVVLGNKPMDTTFLS